MACASPSTKNDEDSKIEVCIESLKQSRAGGGFESLLLTKEGESCGVRVVKRSVCVLVVLVGVHLCRDHEPQPPLPRTLRQRYNTPAKMQQGSTSAFSITLQSPRIFGVPRSRCVAIQTRKIVCYQNQNPLPAYSRIADVPIQTPSWHSLYWCTDGIIPTDRVAWY